SSAPDALNERLALLAQQALDAADGVALAVKQVAHAAEEIDIVRAVIAPAPAPLQRPDLRETAFPESQHMLRNVDLFGNFADRAECVRRFFQCPAPLAVSRRFPCRRRRSRN